MKSINWKNILRRYLRKLLNKYLIMLLHIFKNYGEDIILEKFLNII